VVGDSLSRGTEAPICRPGREAHEVCCLLGAEVRNVTERVAQHVKSTDDYLLLLFAVGTNDTASQNLGGIQEDFKGLGMKAKIFGAKVIFSSILPVGGRGSARNRQITSVNSCILGWCRHEDFDFNDNGTFFDDCNLSERDWIHLSRRSKGTFGSSLDNLVWRVLN